MEEPKANGRGARRRRRGREGKTVNHLTREQILGRDDLKREVIEVPEWGGSIVIRELRASEREVFEKRVIQAGGSGPGFAKTLGDLRASLVVKCIIDPATGERIFDDSDVKALNENSATAIARVFALCSRLSGISSEVVDSVVGESGATSGDGSS